ncbi:MAG: AzlD domain-containing protein [Hyphomicrobiaceae bacterium]|nr:AzlD domain-containing protein [Hyphomicrobiaceae bacterium]
MSELQSGWSTALILLAISLLVHEPWRWIGLFLGRNLNIESSVFQWVRSVATALVAGLVMRLVLFPAGALQGVSLGVRSFAMVAGVAAFFYIGRRLSVGVGAGALALAAGTLIIG